MNARFEIGAELLSRSKPGDWGNPVWNGEHMAAGIQPGEGWLLYGLVRALKPHFCLEVGTSHGYSTLFIATALRDLGEAGFVATVEIDGNRQKDAQKNIIEAGLFGIVQWWDRIPPGALDFAFFDAGHTSTELIQYLDACGRRPPVIAVHDAAWENHAQALAVYGGYNMVMFPWTSHSGIAILERH